MGLSPNPTPVIVAVVLIVVLVLVVVGVAVAVVFTRTRKDEDEGSRERRGTQVTAHEMELTAKEARRFTEVEGIKALDATDDVPT